MMDKKYSSFEQINKDLKILRLEREVDKEQLKLNIEQLKNSFYPTSLLGGLGGITKKFLLTMVIKKFVKKLS